MPFQYRLELPSVSIDHVQQAIKWLNSDRVSRTSQIVSVQKDVVAETNIDGYIDLLLDEYKNNSDADKGTLKKIKFVDESQKIVFRMDTGDTSIST